MIQMMRGFSLDLEAVSGLDSPVSLVVLAAEDVSAAAGAADAAAAGAAEDAADADAADVNLQSGYSERSAPCMSPCRGFSFLLPLPGGCIHRQDLSVCRC
jgi:hypothetical protein